MLKFILISVIAFYVMFKILQYIVTFKLKNVKNESNNEKKAKNNNNKGEYIDYEEVK